MWGADVERGGHCDGLGGKDVGTMDMEMPALLLSGQGGWLDFVDVM